MGLLLRFIGPLTVAPTISLVGLSLYGASADFAGKFWAEKYSKIRISDNIYQLTFPRMETMLFFGLIALSWLYKYQWIFSFTSFYFSTDSMTLKSILFFYKYVDLQ